MPHQNGPEPTGERVRALEVGQINVLARLQAIEAGQQKILLALERRTVTIRIGLGLLHFFELVAAAAAGAEAPRLLKLAGG